MTEEESSLKKYSVEIRLRDEQNDEIIIRTNDFREALEKYDELKGVLSIRKDACSFDMACFYVLVDAYHTPGEYFPVVFSSLEPCVCEW